MRTTHPDHLFVPGRIGNGLAGGAGAASGSLLPDADRPFSRPSGQLPRRHRHRSRALRVPAGPPAAALDQGRAPRGGRHAAPRGGWRRAAQPRATRGRDDSAEIRGRDGD
jgi:hypothetical protein